MKTLKSYHCNRGTEVKCVHPGLGARTGGTGEDTMLVPGVNL